MAAVATLLPARMLAAQAEAASAIYVRSDTDHTLVIAPRVRVQAPLAEPTRVTVGYAADIWTSASIDIRTSASKVPVTEQRDELDVSIDHELGDLTFTAAYRLSDEPDYVSHGVSGGFSYDFAQNNSTIALGLSGSGDHVGRAGDPTFSRSVGTFGGRLTFTQVLGVGTLMQGIYELSRTAGYLASPYRFVPIGPSGECTKAVMPDTDLSALCVPEADPKQRLRHALALELRQALSGGASFGLAYRFYTDDWGIVAHTARAELDVHLDDDSIFGVRYRFYTQGGANFYRAQYLEPAAYVTRDKELSPLSSHRGGLEIDRVWHFAHDHKLTSTLTAAVIYYSYRAFIPLDHITAFELNAALVYAP
jgi:hypothetical protein